MVSSFAFVSRLNVYENQKYGLGMFVENNWWILYTNRKVWMFSATVQSNNIARASNFWFHCVWSMK